MLVCRLLRDDTKKEILFQALNIIYRGKARAEPNLRGGVCQEFFPLSSGC